MNDALNDALYDALYDAQSRASEERSCDAPRCIAMRRLDSEAPLASLCQSEAEGAPSIAAIDP